MEGYSPRTDAAMRTTPRLVVPQRVLAVKLRTAIDRAMRHPGREGAADPDSPKSEPSTTSTCSGVAARRPLLGEHDARDVYLSLGHWVVYDKDMNAVAALRSRETQIVILSPRPALWAGSRHTSWAEVGAASHSWV